MEGNSPNYNEQSCSADSEETKRDSTRRLCRVPKDQEMLNQNDCRSCMDGVAVESLGALGCSLKPQRPGGSNHQTTVGTTPALPFSRAVNVVSAEMVLRRML
jgi:hypothetical protein